VCVNGWEMNGHVFRWHRNGRKSMECYYEKNKLEGKCKEFYESGDVKREVDYKNGVKDGVEREWSRDGWVVYLCEYQLGLRHGGEMTCDPESGERSIYHEFKLGKLHGKSIIWNDDGTKYMETDYVMNVTSRLVVYGGGDRKVRETEFKDGVMSRSRGWNSDGSLWYECVYEGESERMVVLNDDKGRNCALEEGDVEVWKGCVSEDGGKFVIVKLLVPGGAKRVTPINRKNISRVECGKVVQIIDESGKEYEVGRSLMHKRGLVYRVGEMVYAKNYEPSVNVECGAGINVHKHPDHCMQWKGWM